MKKALSILSAILCLFFAFMWYDWNLAVISGKEAVYNYDPNLI